MSDETESILKKINPRMEVFKKYIWDTYEKEISFKYDDEYDCFIVKVTFADGEVVHVLTDSVREDGEDGFEIVLCETERVIQDYVKRRINDD